MIQLEERICACGCKKVFRCLPASKAKYTSLHCMELAGALPPPIIKGGRGPKGASGNKAGAVAEDEADDIPPLIDDDEEIKPSADATPLT